MEWFIIIVIVIMAIVFYSFYRLDLSNSRRANLLSVLPKEFVVLDIETTGLDSSKHEIIEIAAIRIRPDTDNQVGFQALIRPSVEIPENITQITGINQELIEKEGRDLKSAISEFVDFIGDLRLVAYNAEFDMAFLKRAGEKYGFSLKNPYSCALKMARRAWPGLKSYKLGDIAAMGGQQTTGHHRALKDCELTTIVYTAAVAELKTLM